MNKLILTAVALATIGFGNVTFDGGIKSAEAKAQCGQKTAFQNWKPCDKVPNTSYDGGGVNITTVSATACFTSTMYDIITRPDGTNEFVAALVYGGGAHEKVRTAHNTNCWTQNVKVGTFMAVYVTCKEYTGWVAAKVTASGKFTMKPVGWKFQPKWM